LARWPTVQLAVPSAPLALEKALFTVAVAAAVSVAAAASLSSQ